MTTRGKRRTWRKLLSALLVMSMLLGTMSTSAFAADPAEPSTVEEAAAQPESKPQPKEKKADEEKVSTPKTDSKETKKEEPKKEDTKQEESKQEESKQEDTKQVESEQKDTKQEEPKQEDTKQEDTKQGDDQQEESKQEKKEETQKEAEKYTVRFKVNNSDAGVITVDGSTVNAGSYKKDVEEGKDFKFSVTAKEGFDVESVKANGANAEKNGETGYVVRSVKADTEIAIQYKSVQKAARAKAVKKKEVPEVVKNFLDAVEKLSALGGVTEENAEEFNKLGQAAMDAYEAVQDAGLEDYEGVEDALMVLMGLADSVTGGAEMMTLNTGHRISVRFTVLYVDSSFSTGYNYGSSESATFVCQYSTNHSDTAYNNHTIAISDIQAAANRLSINNGFKVVGWTKTASANPSIYPFSGTPTACNKGSTIYIVAKKSAKTYTLKYDANGGSGEPGTQTQESTASSYDFTISSTKPTRSGYEFLGWSTNQYATSPNYYGGGTINVTGTTTLYAVWKQDNGNGISISKTRVSINDDTSKTSADPGDEIKWNITVTNNSNVTKTVILTEKFTGAYFTATGTGTQTITLAANESKTVTVKYTVKNADKGSTIYNTVSASTGKLGDKENPSAKDGGTPVGPVDDGKGISISKTRVSINNDTSKTSAEPGDEIKWNVTVTNNSNVTKTVILTEKLMGACFEETNTGIQTITLAAGGSKTVTVNYTVKKADKGSTIYNTVGASTGTPGENPEAADNGTTVLGEDPTLGNDKGTFTISKTFDNLPANLIPSNFAISYEVTYTVDGATQRHKENGSVSMTKDGNTYTGVINPTVWSCSNWTQEKQLKYKTVIKLTESNAEVEGYTFKFSPKYLADATVNGLTATFNLDGSTFSKTLSLVNDYTQNAEEDNGEGISIEKTRTSINGDATKTTAKPNDVIKWNIKVTNKSNVEKTVKLTEKLNGVTLSKDEVTLAAGASETVTAEYTVKSEDAGKTLYNTVAATSGTGEKENPEAKDEGTQIDVTATWRDGYTETPIKTETVAKDITDEALRKLYPENPTREGYEFDGWKEERDDNGNITITAQWKPIDSGNGIEVTKTRTSAATAKVGETITWDITVTNKSNVEKTVTLRELPGVTLSENNLKIAAGDTKTVQATYTVQESDAGKKFVNTVVATTGDPGDKENPEAKDEGTQIDVTVTATWMDGYTETPIKSETVAKDITDEALRDLYPETPTREGHEFVEWNVERDDDGNITITAVWRESANTPDPTPTDPTPTDPTPINPTPNPTPIQTPTPAAPAATAPAPAAVAPAAAAPATPTAPAAAAPAPAAVAPAVAAADEEVPLANQDVEPDETVREIADEDVPLAEGLPNSWALLNLILAILTVLASALMLIFYFIGKKNENEEEEDDERIQQFREDEEEDEEELKRKGIFRLLSIIPAVVSVIFFILTEDMRNPMIFVDRWTLWMVVFALANVVLTLLSKKKRKEEDNDNNKQRPNYGRA